MTDTGWPHFFIVYRLTGLDKAKLAKVDDQNFPRP